MMAHSEQEKSRFGSPADGGADNQLQSLLKRDSKRGRRKVLVVVLVLAAAAIGVFAWQKTSGAKPAASADSYKTEIIKRGDLISTVTATGTLQAVNTVEVGAEISGRIEAIHADFNDTVKKGQLLAELDREQYEAALDEAAAKVSSAEASVAQMRATLDESQKAADRAEALSKKGLISQKELESALASATRSSASTDSAKANLSLAKASLEAARSRLDKTRVYSPIDGIVLSRKVEIGQAVNAGMQTPVLFVIVEDLRKMVLSTQVDEADIGAISAGQEAVFTVDAYPDQKFKSVVSEVRNVATVSQSVVSYETRLDVENPELLLKPGMTATADITTKAHRGVLLVPNAALRFTPPEMAEKHQFGPPIPFLGKRNKEGESNAKKKEEQKEKGKQNGNQGVLWTLRGGKPERLTVKKIAMDGAFTAVEGQEIKEGMEIIVDLAPGTENGK